MKSFPMQSETEFLHLAPVRYYNCLIVKKLRLRLRAFSYTGLSLWNNLDNSLETTVYLNDFEDNFKDNYISGKIIKQSER